MSTKTSLSTDLTLSQADSRFRAEISTKDDWRSVSAMYRPKIVKADDYVFDEEYGENTHDVELELLRHGQAFIRVYNAARRPNIEVIGQLAQKYPTNSTEIFNLVDEEFQFRKEYKLATGVGRFEGDSTGSIRHVQYEGRETELIRERLVFRNSSSETITYADQNPLVSLAGWSTFYLENGSLLSPDNYPDNTELGTYRSVSMYSDPRPGNDRRPAYRGNTFSSKIGFGTFLHEPKITGVLIVEYYVEYELFSILYDFHEPRRIFELVQNKDIKTGTYIEDTEGTVVLDETAIKNLNKINWRGFKYNEDLLPLFLVQDGVNEPVVIDFSPPQPDFNDQITEELPEKTIYREFIRERIYPDGAASGNTYTTVDTMQKLTLVDLFGKIRDENVEAVSSQGVISAT